jgi:hypothetical protein
MDNGLEFRVAMTQARYTLDDEITVQMYLWNFSDDDLVVNSRFAVNLDDFPGEVAISLTGPDGGPVPFVCRVNVGEPYAEDFSTVVPWNCVGRQFELPSCFDLEEAGRYELSATYRNEWSGGHVDLEAWTGTLQSNTVSFEVTE